MDRLTSTQIIEHADGTTHEQMYCFDHLWGPAYFKKGTKDYDEYLQLVKRLVEYENTGLTPEQIKEMDRLYKAKSEELAECKARQQDNTLNLPCKIGQEVYIVSLNRTGYTTGEVVSIKIGAHGVSLRIYIPSDKQHINRAFEQIGKSVFFERASVEKALVVRRECTHEHNTKKGIRSGRLSNDAACKKHPRAETSGMETDNLPGMWSGVLGATSSGRI